MRWQPRRSLWRTPEGRHPRQLPRELFSLAPFSFSAHSYLPPPVGFFFLLQPETETPADLVSFPWKNIKTAPYAVKKALYDTSKNGETTPLAPPQPAIANPPLKGLIGKK